MKEEKMSDTASPTALSAKIDKWEKMQPHLAAAKEVIQNERQLRAEIGELCKMSGDDRFLIEDGKKAVKIVYANRFSCDTDMVLKLLRERKIPNWERYYRTTFSPNIAEIKRESDNNLVSLIKSTFVEKTSDLPNFKIGDNDGS